MSYPNNRIKQVALKVERAKRHFAELAKEVSDFLSTFPYAVGTRRQPETDRFVYYVAAVEPTPDSLAVVAGDVIQCLMSALDHLAYQLVCADTGDMPPNPRWIYFPIQDDADKYESKKAGKMAGASPETFEAIDALRPYRGGNDLLWMLYRLNNIEKHRTLFTVGSQAAGIGLGQMLADAAKQIPEEDRDPKGSEMMDAMIASLESAPEFSKLFLMPADKGFPLEPGFELYVASPGAQPNPKQTFRFSIVLNEPGIAEGKPLMETLDAFIKLVESILESLKPRLT